MKPDWCPQRVWDEADKVGEAIHGRHERGWVMWPLISADGVNPAQEIVAKAILAAEQRERESIADHADATADHYDSEAVIGAIGSVAEARAADKALRGFATAIRSLGHHAIEIDAARAYDRAARELHGAFATLNFPDEVQS